MAKWNFFVSNTSLIKELDTSGNDVNPQSQSFLAPTLDLQGSKIVFKDNGSYKTALLFTEIGTIDGDIPTDLQDAYDKIIALIPNSGGGGGSVGTLQQVTDNGNTIVSGDFQANFEASAIEVTNQATGTFTSIDATEGVVIKTDSFQGKIKTDNLTAVRTNQLPDNSGTIALTSDIPTVITPETGIYYFNDFLGEFKSSTNDGNIIGDGNVGQTTTAPNSDANKQGFANVNTTAASAGYGNIYIGQTSTGGANFILGGGITSYETLIWLPSLSTSGERFSCLIGFSSGVANQNASLNNIAFLYDEGNIAFGGGGGASANWRAVTTDGTRTFTDTGVAVNAGAFIKLRIVINADASSVGFFIDNTLVATHTTNIPSGNTKRLSVRNYIQKSVGGTQRLLILDYVKLQQTFTTAR